MDGWHHRGSHESLCPVAQVPAGEKENTTYSATTRNGSRSQRQYAFRLVK